MDCVHHRCTHPERWCDSKGRCPDGYTNYWGLCLKMFSTKCQHNLECPANTGCNKEDGNCYMISCFSSSDCAVTKFDKSLPKSYPDCFKPNAMMGICYK